MFPSRVLPPLQTFINTYASESGNCAVPVRPDALLEHRIIMTTDESKLSPDYRPRSPDLRKESRTTVSEDRVSPTSDKNSVITDASGISASAGTRKKRRLSQTIDTASRSRVLSNVSIRDDTPSQICLCQPDPKVPRPRNAFILYRQHHQAKVVNEHPGLANPDISKIIGDQWRNSSQEVKAHWKKLAEEEKARHQRQYPDYRYQPKRGRNSVAATTVQPGQASPRCPKCGGKSMATPTHIPSPTVRPVATPAESPMYQLQSAVAPRTPYGFPGSYNMSPVHSSFVQRPMPIGRSSMDRVSPDDHYLSPDAKRVRYDMAPNNHRQMSRALPSGLMSASDRLPRQEFFSQQSPGFTIAPAPPGPRNGSHGPNGSRHESLTLAPLKIKPNDNAAVAQGKSVEAMIMSIPPIHKIKTLQRISMPMQKSGPTSPPRPVRGALLAIEYGDDRIAGGMIADAIRDELTRHNEYVTRAFETPKLEHHGRQAKNSDVLKLMDHWHAVSDEIAKYITTIPDSEAAHPESPVSPRTMWVSPDSGRNTPSGGDMAATRRSKRKADGQLVHSGTSDSNPAASRLLSAAADSSSQSPSPAPGPPGPIPVALVPNYQLTSTDYAACQVPISDEYSPLDHWRWVAAIWRGTVGPDVTITIRGLDEESGGTNSPGVVTQGPKGRAGSGSGVDIRLEECRTVVVRVERKGEVGEGMVRRVAFEVGEWIRGLRTEG